MPLSTIDTSSISGLGYGFKNRIINGAMVIDQRNAGASVTISDSGSGQYTLDRWRFYENTDGVITAQQSSTAPDGFKNSLLVTVTTADTSLASGQLAIVEQKIEGLNSADLMFGSAAASTVTLGFWVRSNLTGTFGGSIRNAADTRSYPFSYTINSANTFEYKTVTISGDTTGSWLTTNTVGIVVTFGLAVGSTFLGTANTWASANYQSVTGQTNLLATIGNTFYITGVQLEKGTVATSFDYRPYGAELALCQRYYWKNSPESTYGWIACGRNQSGYASMQIANPVPMRSAPTFVISNLGSADGTPTGAITGTYGGTLTSLLQPTMTGQTAAVGTATSLQQNGTASSGYLSASSEL